MTILDCGPAALTVTLGDPEDPTLVIPGLPDDPATPGTWWNALEAPDWSLRYDYAPSSRWVPGQVLLGAVEDLASIPMRVAVRDASLAALVARQAALRAALAAWPGTFTLTATPASPDDDVTVVSGPWETYPTVPTWGPVEPVAYGLLVAEASFSIPVQPVGA